LPDRHSASEGAILPIRAVFVLAMARSVPNGDRNAVHC
jgi:hypothetical protein